jgi:tRNA (guanine-N7-)-methyltransferase
LSRLDLIHPDPWPKRRHWKRRFVQDATVSAMGRVIKPDGEFRFVSDIDDYCAWTLAHLLRSPDFVWLRERAVDWQQPWDGYTMTRYGQEGRARGTRGGVFAVSQVPHPEERAERRLEGWATGYSWFETRNVPPHHEGR